MKSFIFGLATIIVLAVVGIVAFRGSSTLISRLFPPASPSETPLASPLATPTPTPSAPVVSYKSYVPVKKGLVKGVATSRPTPTSTPTPVVPHTSTILYQTSICPVSYTLEMQDIKDPLWLKYKLINNTSFGITIWRRDGNELFQNTTFGGNSGTITTISGVDYLKIRVESKTCAGNNDNWLTLTAER